MMIDSASALEKKSWPGSESREDGHGSAVSFVSDSEGEHVPTNVPQKGLGMQIHASAETEQSHVPEDGDGASFVKERVSGRVKWFNWNKGFGFITVDGCEEEVFVHQTNIDSDGFRSLYENEVVEFELVVGEGGKKKAFHVTGPGGQPPQGSQGQGQHRPPSYKMGAYGMSSEPSMSLGPQTMPGSYPQMAQGPGQNQMGYYGQLPAEAYYPPTFYGMPGSTYAPAYAQHPMMGVPPGGRGFYPGGKNWVGARPPPPGTPGFSSGLQVVVHNLPWDCTWQELKAAFEDIGPIERADIVFDSHGRSRGFGVVRFPDCSFAELAVEKMNNKTIGGRVVSVRVDRFA